MLENPDFAEHFDYAPHQQYDTKGRHYENFMSGDWAWKQAVSKFLTGWTKANKIILDIISEDPETHGSMFVPIILGSDKTVTSVGTGNTQFWPIYGSIGNIHNGVRRAHGEGLVLIGLLAIPKGMSCVWLGLGCCVHSFLCLSRQLWEFELS